MYRSEYLYEHIDELIADEEVFPICVPTYNRPKATILKFAEKLPMIIFIRREQEELYAEYKGKCKIVLLDGVVDLGTTRAAIVDWAWDNGYDNIFMLDDDVCPTDFLLPGKSTKSDKYFMRMNCTDKKTAYIVYLQFFKMWIWMIRRCSDKLTLSGPGAKSDTWSISHKDANVKYCSGSIIQCVHLNVKNLKENNINYGRNDLEGTEDYALQYKIMAEGLYTCLFKDLAYDVPGVGSGKGGCYSQEKENLINVYHKYIRAFYENVLDEENADKVSTKVARSGIPSVKFIWSRWRIKDEFMNYTIQDIQNDLESLQ